ncbi:MAG: hypothetical protein ACEPOZ_16430 [Marinifilaceae bacterium]
MLFLLLAIITSSGIFVSFKYLEKYRIDILSAIIINYLAATLLGITLSGNNISLPLIQTAPWLEMALLIGFLFIVMFFIIGLSTQKTGIAVTTLASKMSFVIPMLFSLIYYNETVSSSKILGFVMGTAAVGLAVIKKRNLKNRNEQYYWLPLLLFFGAGVVDSLVKYAQDLYLKDQGSSQFSTILFAVACLSGIICQTFRKGKLKLLLHPQTLLGGSILGIFNFGSLYFLIASLNSSGFDSSIVFSIINMGIVSLSLIIGISLFREKLTFINIIGVVLAFIATFILTNFA